MKYTKHIPVWEHACSGYVFFLYLFPMTTVNLTAPQAHLCYLSLDTTQAKWLQLFHSNYWPAPAQYCDLHHIYQCHSFALLAAAHSQQFAVHTSCIHKALDRACSSLSRGNVRRAICYLCMNRGFPKPTHFWAVHTSECPEF